MQKLNDLSPRFHSGSQEMSLKPKQEEDLKHVSDMSDVKQGQKKKKSLYLQLVLAGVKYSGDTEQDSERNEMKVSLRRVHLAFQVLAQTHSGV